MRELTFSWQDAPVALGLEKVDRSKLYGFVEEVVLDEDGTPCELATLAGDGRTVIPKGGTGLVYLDHEGRWIERDDMTAVTPEGEVLEATPSSFDAPIALETRATADDVLGCDARLVYQLHTTDSLPEALAAALGEGAIFTFPFAYRASLTPDTAFLLEGAQGGLFLLACVPLEVQFVRHTPRVPPELVDGDGTADGELLDFDLL